MRVTETLTSNKIPACQIRLLKQSAIKALTCSRRKLTAMEAVNDTSKSERSPKETHIWATARVRQTGSGWVGGGASLHLAVMSACVCEGERQRMPAG